MCKKKRERGESVQQPKRTANWRTKQGIIRLDWPANSPDLNPIENVWAVLKANVKKHRPSTVQQLTRAIYKEWKELTEEYAQALVSSMYRRVQAQWGPYHVLKQGWIQLF